MNIPQLLKLEKKNTYGRYSRVCRQPSAKITETNQCAELKPLVKRGKIQTEKSEHRHLKGPQQLLALEACLKQSFPSFPTPAIFAPHVRNLKAIYPSA